MHIVVMSERRKGKHPGGRPSKFDRGVAAQICRRLSTSTDNLEAICREAGIHVDTFYEWKTRHPEFSEAATHAMEAHFQIMGELLVEHADKDVIVGDRSDSARVQLRKLQNETRRWMLSKRLPQLYGDRLQLSTEVEFLVPDIRPAAIVEAGSNSELPSSKPALPTGENKAPEGVQR